MKTYIQKLIILISAVAATAIVVACDNEDHKSTVVADAPPVQPSGKVKLNELNVIQNELNAQGISFDAPVRTNVRIESANPQELTTIRTSLIRYIKTGNEFLPLVDSPDAAAEGDISKPELRFAITSRLAIAQALLQRIEHPGTRQALTLFESEYIRDYQGLIDLTRPTRNSRSARAQARELRASIDELAPQEVIQLRGRTKAMLNLAFANKRPPEVILAYQTIFRAIPSGPLADRIR